MHTKSIVNGLSDHHSIVMTMLKTQLSKIEPTEIKYRYFKDFDEIAYCMDLGHALEKIDFDQDPNDFTTFSELVTQVTQVSKIEKEQSEKRRVPIAA